MDCLLPRDDKTEAASAGAVTPLEHFTSLAYEEQQGLLEWYLALMMG